MDQRIVCEECGESNYITILTPDRSAIIGPDVKGDKYFRGVLPFWLCPACGHNRMVKVEEEETYTATNASLMLAFLKAANITDFLIVKCPVVDCGPDEDEDGDPDCGGESGGNGGPGKTYLH